MINSAGLVNDGLNDDCTSNGQTVWSYNQGLAIGGGLELWRATHDPSVLATAEHLADAAITAPELTQGGVLTESCDALDRTCDDNGKQFKGIFLRYLMDAADTTHAARYAAVRAAAGRHRLGQRPRRRRPARRALVRRAPTPIIRTCSTGVPRPAR